MTGLPALNSAILSILFLIVFGSLVQGDTHTPPDAKVFVLAGQSNAYGYGSNANKLPPELNSYQTDVRLWYEEGQYPSMLNPIKRIKSDGWEPLCYQIRGKYPVFGLSIKKGFASEIKLGRVLADVLPEDVYIIKFGIGSTNLAQHWSATIPGPLYEELCRIMNEALGCLEDLGRKPKLSGFFWMQGEKDGANVNHANNYENNLSKFIEQLRIDFDEPELPFIIGRLNAELHHAPFLNISEANLTMIRHAQEMIAVNIPHVTFVDTDHVPLKEDYHFSARGQVVLGMDFACTYLSMAGHDSINVTDVATTTLVPHDEIRHAVTGEPNAPYMVFASLEEGPNLTPWGCVDLGMPMHLLFSNSLSDCGYDVITLEVPALGGELEFYSQTLVGNEVPGWAAACGGGAIRWVIE